MDDKEILKKLFIDLCEASINKDIKKLKEILAPNYILIHMTGMKQTKEEYINSVQSGELLYFDFIYESIDINTNSDEAVIIAKTKILASPFGMNKTWWNLKQKILVEKISGKWLFLKSQASTY